MDFSIIIPAKNEEKNIAACLDSISAVDYPKDLYEVIVIDNGSTDRTVDIAESKNADVYVQPDLTISGLRNYGAEQAQGKILAFLDADCTVKEDWLKNAAKYLCIESVVSFGSAAVLPHETTWVQRAWFPVRNRDRVKKNVEWLESANVFVRKDSFEKVMGFDETLMTCEDYDLSVRLRSVGDIVYDPDIVAVHHREPATINDFFKKEIWRSKSNRERFFSLGFDKNEIPSLLIPPIYFILFCSFFIFLILFGFYDGDELNFSVVLFLIIFQTPIFLISIKKVFPSKEILNYFQLFFLLNIYFFARGLSFFSKN